MWNVVARSRDGSLAASAVDLGAVDIRKRYHLALRDQALVLLQDQVVMVAASAVDLVVEDSVEAIAVVTDLVPVVVLVTKVAAVGLADSHLQMRRLVLVVDGVVASTVEVEVEGLIAVQQAVTANP